MLNKICYEANATYLPGDVAWDRRLREIAEAGFTTVEILFPQRQDLDELEALLRTYDLRLALIDTEFRDTTLVARLLAIMSAIETKLFAIIGIASEFVAMVVIAEALALTAAITTEFAARIVTVGALATIALIAVGLETISAEATASPISAVMLL